MIWLSDESVLALQAGTYRWLSAGDILRMGSAARVEGSFRGGPQAQGEGAAAKRQPGCPSLALDFGDV